MGLDPSTPPLVARLQKEFCVYGRVLRVCKSLCVHERVLCIWKSFGYIKVFCVYVVYAPTPCTHTAGRVICNWKCVVFMECIRDFIALLPLKGFHMYGRVLCIWNIRVWTSFVYTKCIRKLFALKEFYIPQTFIYKSCKFLKGFNISKWVLYDRII